MKDTFDTYVIDAGNTSVKIGFFHEDELIQVDRYTLLEFKSLNEIHQSLSKHLGILSSVLSNNDTESIVALLPNIILLKDLPEGIQYEYSSPLTLGKDRIANAFGAQFLNPSKSSVVIDIGTCIKFDLLLDGIHYHGGSISPGIRLRYKALNDYTGKLPLLNDNSNAELVGNSTYNSIHSGVINGIKNEIEGMIDSYIDKYDDLTFFVTGGDAKHFDFHPKNNIFANINLTLLGLYQILKLNGK